MVLKGIYVIRHASLEDKPGVENRENELNKELGTGKRNPDRKRRSETLIVCR